jgi:aspartyl aminopeptidase
MENYKKVAENLLDFRELKENEDWNVETGGKYYVIRNDSTIAAFHIPEVRYNYINGFHIVAAHSDSPTFKIKDNPDIKVEDKYIKLNTEKYGGMIMSSWLDRPLSVAGRIAVKEGERIVSRLVNVDRDMLVIPNMPIHMNRDINSGMNYNPQVDLLPLYSQAEIENGKEFMDIIAEYGKVNKEDILAHDLYLYVRESGRIIGGNEEYILSPKLDDLQCVYSAITALIQADDNAENDSHTQKYINMCVIFDNEEVGSGTKQGADSTFMEDVIVRIQESLGENNSWLRKMIADSMLISADNAHAVHPNHPEKSDPTNRPYVNGGIVIKYHGGQKYTTDAITAAYIKKICMEAKVPYQTFTNRADMAGGSTLGNISTAHVSIPSVDIGLPQLAMHSAVETGGVRDTDYAIQVIKQFFTMA